MAASLFRLLALSSLAVLASNYAPGVTAVSLEAHNFVRHDHSARHHGLIAKRQSTAARKRCRARSTGLESSSTATATSTSAAASTPAPTTTKRAPVSSTTSKAPVETPVTNTPPATGGGKVGIAYAGNVDVVKFIQGSPKVGFVYNWSPFVPDFASRLPGGVQYVPMLWGQKQIGNLRSNIKPASQDFVLGMNEPNQGDQASISPEYAAQLWRENLLPLKSQGYTLVSPAPTNAPSGLTWLKDFHNACQGCSIDRVALHWYGIDTDNFIDHVTSYWNAFSKKLWITEFACQDFSGQNRQCSPDQIWAFMDKTTKFMDNADFVEMYAYFGVLHDMGNVNWANQLIGGDNTPNALGRKYLGL